MKSLALVLVFLCSVVLAAGQGQQCKPAADGGQPCGDEIKKFFTCVNDTYEKKSPRDKDALKRQVRTEAEKCFQNVQRTCAAPKWDSELVPGMPTLNFSDSMKQCLKKKVTEKDGKILAECLSNNGFKNLNSSILGPGVENYGLEAVSNMNSVMDGILGLFKDIVIAIKAADACGTQKNPQDPVKMSLTQCLFGIKKKIIKTNPCEIVKPCEDKIMPPSCKVSVALCNCKKKKESEMSKSLEKLAPAGTQSVLAPSIIEVIAGQTPSDMIKMIKDCYSETKETRPPNFDRFSSMMENPTRVDPQMKDIISITSSGVLIMADMLRSDAADKCEPCP